MPDLDQQFQEGGVIPRVGALAHHARAIMDAKFE
jgi:hypothetical protein